MKNNKIIKGFLISMIVTVFISLSYLNVFASSFSVGASKSSVAPGGSFTVTISTGGAGQFSVSASNGSVSSSSIFVDGGGKVSVTAGQSGTTTVSVTAVDVTATDESSITGTKSVSVSVKSPSSGGGSNTSGGTTSGGSGAPTENVDKRSKDNNLSSLSVSTGTLSPAFSANETTYKVELTSDVKKISINAKAKDAKATVSGTGEHELKVGENNIIVTVKAENGSKKTYTVSVYVTEKPTQFVKKDNQEYGILSDLSKADTPKGFEKTTIKIEDKEVTALKNDKLGLTLLYLQDSEQKTGFYIYENNTVVGEYKTISINGKQFILINTPSDLEEVKGLKSGKVKIGEVELDGWSFEDKEHANFSIVYLMNEAGEKNLYSYEKTEGTLQKYEPNSSSQNSLITYLFMGTTALFAISTGVMAYLYISFKKKSISTIKDYYERKNQN